ncbi:hypothetical protein ACXXDK_13690 [Deinococcus sp. PESE-38]
MLVLPGRGLVLGQRRGGHIVGAGRVRQAEFRLPGGGRRASATGPGRGRGGRLGGGALAV